MSKKTALVYAAAGVVSFGVGYLIGNAIVKKISAKLIPNELKETGKEQAAQILKVNEPAPTTPTPEITLTQFSCATIPPYTAQMDVATFDPSIPHHPFTPVTIEKLKGLEERGWTVKNK